jgi:hypothetical protein
MLRICADGLIETKRGITRGRLHKGYLYYKGMAVHRLVLNLFQPTGYHPVWMERGDHINRVTTDNRIANLRWSNPVLNGLNSVRAGSYVTKPKFYMVQIRVMGQRHACSVSTVQDAIYLVHRCNRTTFDALEVLYKFLARKDAQVPEGRNPHKWLARHFPVSFLRRLSGFPAKQPAGRRRTQN